MHYSRITEGVPSSWRRFFLSLLIALTAGLSSAADFSGWDRKMEITFGGFDASVSETHFPALVSLSEGILAFKYADFESVTGGDLRFSAFDGTDMRLYLDGVPVDTNYVGANIDDDNLPLRIGADDSGKWFDGVLDEVRISRVTRSDNWVRATYLTAASNNMVTTYDVTLGPPSIENLSPTGLSANAGTLRADLVSTGGQDTTVWVYYGDEDGTNNASAWDTNLLVGTGIPTGVVTKAVADLVESGIYYYRFVASNTLGTTWSPESTRFRTPTDFSAWGAKVSIAFTNCINTTPLELFPVLVKLDETLPGFSYDQFASTTGDDLRFAEADGVTELDYEIDNWDTGGVSTVWVQIPSLTNNTQIWAYWNNALASTGETARTWSEGFLGVYHLQDDSSDSTSGGNNGTDNGTIGPGSGQVSGGYAFTPNAYVNLGSGARWESIDDENSFTLSGWIKPNTLGGDQALFGRWGGAAGSKQCLLWLDVGNNKTNFVSIIELPSLKTSESTGIDAVLGQWQYVSAVADGTTLSVYVNGIHSSTVGSGYNLAAVPTRNIYLGMSGNNDKYLNGSLDEARIAYTPRSQEWLRTEYLNMMSNDWFNTVGTVESAPAVQTLTATDIAGLSATMRGNVTSTGTAETAVWVYWGQSDGTNNPASWDTNTYIGTVSAEGVVDTNVTGLDHETTYYYRFFASNSVDTTCSSSSETFDTITDFSRWQEKLEIAFTNLSGRIPLTNFPVLVRLSDSTISGFSYYHFQSDQGHDLRFSAADQVTPLNYEVEEWNPDGESTVWVKIPVLTNNASIWAFWGNTADAASPSAYHGSDVWSDEYLGVYHLHADSDDSTGNGNDGAQEAGPVNTTGVVGDGLDFAGGARVDLGTSEWDAINANDTFTLGTWVNPDVINADMALFGKFAHAQQQLLVWLDGNAGGGGLLNYVVYDDSGPRTPEGSGTPAKQDTWQYVVATSDGSILRMYVDGALSGTSGTEVNMGSSTTHMSLGTDNGDSGNRPLDGSLDEARMTHICRPLDWIWAEYVNMASNDIFNTYGEILHNKPTVPAIANLAPTGTTYQSAWVRADLVSTGTAETTVWVYYGKTDGTNNPAAWDTNVSLGRQTAESILLSEEITGLDAYTDYFYRFHASNSVGGVWADATETFGTALRMGEWTHMVDIEVPYDRSTPLTNFPVLVVLSTNISGFSYGDFAYADGADLRFTPTDGRSLLNYEIEEWNSDGNSYVWVQVPTLVNGSSLHAYWGNPSCEAYPSTTNGATWDNTFRAVWHLDQVGASPDLTDSTTNDVDGANAGTANIDGLVSKGQDCERGTTDDIATGPSSAFIPSNNAPISVSYWAKAESIASGQAENRAITIHQGTPGSAIGLGFGSDDRVESYISGTSSGGYITSASTVETGQWYYVTLTYDGANNHRMYVDGEFDTSINNSLKAGSSRYARIGGYEGSSRYFDGIIDEMRISSIARSADWIYACYMNQRSNTLFDAYGQVQNNFNADLPVIAASSATDILALSATMNASLTSTGSSATAVSLYWGTTDAQSDTLAWGHSASFPGTHAPGALASNITTLGEATTYYYRFRASNAAGNRWSTTASFATYPLPDVDNAGGADVAVGSALLNGSLIAENGAPCGAFTYWGPSDSGSNVTAWANTNDLGGVAVGTFQGDTYAPVPNWSDFTSTNVGNGTGVAGYTSGVWTVTGTGTRIWDPSDHFHYACRQVRGDFDVYCRAGDIAGATHDYRKAGLMARENLTGGSRYAFTMRTPTGTTHLVRMQWRSAQDGSSGNDSYTGGTNEYYWLRLKRTGDAFSSYWAEDTGGTPTSWTQISTTKTIAMNDQVYLGLAVCSYDTVVTSTVQYDGWGGVASDANLLTYGQQYYYRSSATNAYGKGWADSSEPFLTAQPSWVSITNTMAQDLTTTSATFHADLDAEYALFDVYAYWGLTDEGIDPGAWTHSKYVGSYTNVSDLDVCVTDNGMTVDTPYYYTFQATNIAGDIWASSSASYRTVGPPSVTNAAPLDYTAGTATVGGVLTYGENAYAAVYWGLTDGVQDPLAWDHATPVGQVNMGMFQTNITVGAGGKYYYRCYMSNVVSQAWAPATTNFTTPGATLSIADTSVYEGDSGTVNMTFTVTPSLPCASNVTVKYQTSGGTAGVGTDYTAVNAVLTIPAMQAQGTINVPVIGDTEFEWPDEYFYMDLSDATNATLVDSQAVGTIGEDDVQFKDWLYKLEITFDGYQGSETLYNFPVLVTFDSSIAKFNYDQFESPSGHDLRFTDGTRPLSYEIDHWDTTGTSYVWVRVPELSGTDTSIFAYWGATNDLRAAVPAAVSDCVLWLRADAGVQASGNSVTGWLDQSGQGNHASQGTASLQPTLTQSVINSRPVIRFDGAGDYLQVADDSSLDGTTGLTIFTVVTPSNLDDTRPRGLVSKRVSSSSNQSYAQFFYYSGDKLHNDIQDGSGDRFTSATTFVNGKTYITELVFDGSLPAGQRSKLSINGATDVTASESATSISDYSGDLTIGVLNAGYGYTLGGDIAEVIIYRRALSTNETLSVGRYLEQKYDLKSGYGTDAPVFGSDGSTWSEGYAGVWHMREGGAFKRYDSTANSNDSSALQNDPDTAAGKIGRGNDFDGDDSITVPDSTSLGDDTVDSMAVSIWMKSDIDLTNTGDAYRALEKGDSYFVLQGNGAGTIGNGGQNFLVKSGNTLEPTFLNMTLASNQWYHVTGTFDGADTRLYLDGVLIDTHHIGANIDDDNLPLKIGSDDIWPNRKYFDGVLDEVRISSVWRSSDWVRAAYRNMANTDTFETKGYVTPTHGPTLFIIR